VVIPTHVSSPLHHDSLSSSTPIHATSILNDQGMLINYWRLSHQVRRREEEGGGEIRKRE